MLKTTIFAIIGVIFCLTANCHAAEVAAPANAVPVAADTSKALVVYFSHSGKTKQVAEWIHESVNCDLVELKVVTPYPSDYRTVVDQARKEINSGFRPKLSTQVDNMAQYSTIYVGTPNWWSTMAPPVATFLTGYDFSGKTVIPFVTHGGGGEAACATDMKKLCPEATFRKALVIRDNRVGDSKAEVIRWAKNILTQ